MSTITTREAAEVAAANASGRQPVVFVHGLWLLASSWDAWRTWFEERGYATLAVDWPGDPADVESARRDASGLYGSSVPDIADHVAEVVTTLDRKPILVGHSFGGLLVQIVAGRGLAAATVSIDPAPSKGVLPLPLSALKSSLPVLKNPANRGRNVTLSFAEFRYGFANAVPEDEAHRLYDAFHVPGPGRPIFQVATANLTPSRATAADARNPERGPMLVVDGELDHIVPPVLAKASYQRQRRNSGVTELAMIPGVGHSLVLDSAWETVAQTAYDFVQRQGL